MKKIITTTLLASATTFGLFAFMAFLISSDQVTLSPPEVLTQIEVMQTPEDTAVEEMQKRQFEPPQPPPVMQRNNITPVIAQVGTDFIFQPIGFTVTETDTAINPMRGLPDGDARPIVRVNPKYPMDAARQGIEGWVKLVFDISAIGEVINVKIVDSTPKRIFDKAAKQALRKWKYRAKSVEGKPVSQHNFSVQLDFTMSKNI